MHQPSEEREGKKEKKSRSFYVEARFKLHAWNIL